MRIKCRDTKEIVYSYTDYLKTKHWRDIRALAFQKSNGICKCCKKELSNDFICHHRSYKRVGEERIRILPYNNNLFVRAFQKTFLGDDVITVCRYCHNGESKNHIKLHEFVRVPYWARQEKDST